MPTAALRPPADSRPGRLESVIQNRNSVPALPILSDTSKKTNLADDMVLLPTLLLWRYWLFVFRLEIDFCKSPSSISTGHLLINITSSQQAIELVGQNTMEDGVGDIIRMHVYRMHVYYLVDTQWRWTLG